MRAFLFAFPAANALHTVGLFGRVDIHHTDLAADTAFSTGRFVNPISSKRNRIEEPVNCTQRAEILAEWPIHPERHEN